MKVPNRWRQKLSSEEGGYCMLPQKVLWKNVPPERIYESGPEWSGIGAKRGIGFQLSLQGCVGCRWGRSDERAEKRFFEKDKVKRSREIQHKPLRWLPSHGAAATTHTPGLFLGEPKTRQGSATPARRFWRKGGWQDLCVPNRWPGYKGLNEHLRVGRLSCYHSNRVVLRKKELRPNAPAGSLRSQSYWKYIVPIHQGGELNRFKNLLYKDSRFLWRAFRWNYYCCISPSNPRLLSETSSKSADLIRALSCFKLSHSSPPAFEIKSKLPSLVLPALLIVSHVAVLSPITSHPLPCTLQPLSFPPLSGHTTQQARAQIVCLLGIPFATFHSDESQVHREAFSVSNSPPSPICSSPNCLSLPFPRRKFRLFRLP